MGGNGLFDLLDLASRNCIGLTISGQVDLHPARVDTIIAGSRSHRQEYRRGAETHVLYATKYSKQSVAYAVRVTCVLRGEKSSEVDYRGLSLIAQYDAEDFGRKPRDLAEVANLNRILADETGEGDFLCSGVFRFEASEGWTLRIPGPIELPSAVRLGAARYTHVDGISLSTFDDEQNVGRSVMVDMSPSGESHIIATVRLRRPFHRAVARSGLAATYGQARAFVKKESAS